MIFIHYPSSCSRICSTVLCRRSENQGESLDAQSLHKLPSSNFLLPRRPIFALQILQYFLSNNPMALPSSIIMFLLYNTPNSYAIFFFCFSCFRNKVVIPCETEPGLSESRKARLWNFSLPPWRGLLLLFSDRFII